MLTIWTYDSQPSRRPMLTSSLTLLLETELIANDCLVSGFGLRDLSAASAKIIPTPLHTGSPPSNRLTCPLPRRSSDATGVPNNNETHVADCLISAILLQPL